MTMRKRFTPPTLAASLAAVALLAGCGDGDSSSTEKEEHEAAVTPQKAIAEIAFVRAGLAAGLAAYKQGDAEKADELIEKPTSSTSSWSKARLRSATRS